MPRSIHSNVLANEKKQQIIAAFRKLHAEGFDDCGPVDLARVIDLPWTRCQGKPASGALAPYLRKLIDEGFVKRKSQGTRRGRYLLIDCVD